MGARPLSAGVCLLLALPTIALASGIALPESQDGRLPFLVHKSHGTNRGSVSIGFDTAVRKPRALQLKVKAVPDGPVHVRYWVDCRQDNEWKTIKKRTKVTSGLYDLPLPQSHPGLCFTPMDADYEASGRVTLRVAVRAEVQGGTP